VAAEKLGIPVLREFFGEKLGKRLALQGNQADLIVGNNVYAHVPDINDFTCGLKAVLRPEGVITLEFPHLMELIEYKQFDTVYHEHFSYLSLYSVEKIFNAAGLRIWNVERLPTHGGSLRVYGCHKGASYETQKAVGTLLTEEARRGLQDLQVYLSFQPCANKIKDDLLEFLIEQKKVGKKVAAYGAAAKGNTLLNYAGIKPDLLPFVSDAAVAKQGKYMPGSHIPIRKPDAVRWEEYHYILILPWNISEEVQKNLRDHLNDEASFVTAVPNLKVVK
jgi:hypothetical protein